MNLVAVTLNDGNDFADHASLFNFGFSEFQRIEILSAGELSLYDEKYHGFFKLYVDNSFAYPVRIGEKIMINFELSEDPSEGHVGYARIFIEDNEVHKEPINSIKIVNHKRNILEWFKSLW